jgi:BirA family biotin operon repressor/biotin-[acetyl-CoA-carboxylase] ligase
LSWSDLAPRPLPLPLEIAEPLARAGDRLGPFADLVVWYEAVSSTNDVAAALAERGAGEGLVVAADEQLSGRGRLGRAWVSPAGAGLYVSVVVRPYREAVPLLTLTAGLALADGIESATGLPTHVKWPNDVCIDHRKLAGILAEAGSSQAGVQHVVLGFGVNIRPAAYPLEVASRATCIDAELGRAVDRGLVLAECLAALATRYAQLQAGHAASITRSWRRRAALTFGRLVEWEAAGFVESGVTQDVDETGALLVRTERGIQRLISGEVRWR